jgi:hypothetical protein
MSQAFVRERDEEWLHDVAPTLQALVMYLTRENNGILIYEKKSYFSETYKAEVHEMSDGLSYALNNEGKWFVID